MMTAEQIREQWERVEPADVIAGDVAVRADRVSEINSDLTLGTCWFIELLGVEFYRPPEKREPRRWSGEMVVQSDWTLPIIHVGTVIQGFEPGDLVEVTIVSKP